MAQPSSAASQAPPAAVPPGCKGVDDVDIVPDEGVSPLSRQLLEGCIRRTFTHGDRLTQLIRQGADPGAIGGLRVRGTSGRAPYRWRYSCLSLAIDSPTNTPSPSASGTNDSHVPVVLPPWSSRQLQRDILNALIDGGADMPIMAAVRAGNLTAVEGLLARQANVRGFRVMQLPRLQLSRPFPLSLSREYEENLSPEYEENLLSIFRRLLQHDSTLAAERAAADGVNLVHLAVRSRRIFSQLFIDQYLTLITSHGADTTATNNMGRTPLHWAALHGSPCVADCLCRRLTADDINGGLPHFTPLAEAADRLDHYIQLQQHGEALGEGHSRRIRKYKTVIRVLLRGGATPSVTRLPTVTEEQRRCRQLVLAEYATVLNELSDVTMSAINAALAPQRDHSTLLARLLPLAPHHDGAHPHPSPSNMAFGPHEAEGIAWKIAAFLHEPSAAGAAIDEYLIFDTRLRRRVKAAVGHFVKSTATQTSSNRDVVGGTRYERQGDKRVKVTVLPLQCFALRGSGGRVVGMTGVREVVHRARLDEAISHGVAGVVKDFNEHLGDQDCQFEWGQLGRLSRTGLFVSLGIE
ncbi:unnamed protein product [Vitrella brassicaformis CCMP3155]|uniref:Uncharacterized protein n=1 Tax=Vitrella brassicaformis (strain CCMP3155) TaxID=1169540 RepID=A0A0G4EFG2_VITBC|nr:unnamed protein product [Vitrella brassicaformis CCMP3155]|eukprot:CEL94108.1 unnamed protein product [Vitrella brassicaformis CCMP3155]